MRKSLYSPEHDVLAALLRAVRREAGLGQAEVGRRLGRPQSFVSKYEAGQRRLDLVELRAVCRVLGWDLRAFVARWEAALAATAG